MKRIKGRRDDPGNLVRELEDENVAEKTWQLSGEVAAKKRPVNSLLEEHVIFDHSSVGPPLITEEFSLKLEEIILQRIKDKAWDDVIRTTKTTGQPETARAPVVLDQEKSKQSLLEIYEKEYLRQKQKDKEEVEDERHTEIRSVLQTLFHQLDTLTNFHYTPKMPKPELEMKVDTPSLMMEEVAPVMTSAASQLAPEEIKSKLDAPPVGVAERTATDKARIRRRSKARKHRRLKAQERTGKETSSKKGQIVLAVRKLKASRTKTTFVSSKGVKMSRKLGSGFLKDLQQNVSKKKVTKDNRPSDGAKLKL